MRYRAWSIDVLDEGNAESVKQDLVSWLPKDDYESRSPPEKPFVVLRSTTRKRVWLQGYPYWIHIARLNHGILVSFEWPRHFWRLGDGLYFSSTALLAGTVYFAAHAIVRVIALAFFVVVGLLYFRRQDPVESWLSARCREAAATSVRYEQHNDSFRPFYWRLTVGALVALAAVAPSYLGTMKDQRIAVIASLLVVILVAAWLSAVRCLRSPSASTRGLMQVQTWAFGMLMVLSYTFLIIPGIALPNVRGESLVVGLIAVFGSLFLWIVLSLVWLAWIEREASAARDRTFSIENLTTQEAFFSNDGSRLEYVLLIVFATAIWAAAGLTVATVFCVATDREWWFLRDSERVVAIAIGRPWVASVLVTSCHLGWLCAVLYRVGPRRVRAHVPLPDEDRQLSAELVAAYGLETRVVGTREEWSHTTMVGDEPVIVLSPTHLRDGPPAWRRFVILHEISHVLSGDVRRHTRASSIARWLFAHESILEHRTRLALAERAADEFAWRSSLLTVNDRVEILANRAWTRRSPASASWFQRVKKALRGVSPFGYRHAPRLERRAHLAALNVNPEHDR